jgi:hypothetical protein
LTQSTWRKIQESGFVTQYSEKKIKHFCGQLESLGFLNEDKVVEGMEHIKTITPEGF